MSADPRILVIGSADLRASVARALPRCERVTVEAPLSGVWLAGHREFDAVILGLSSGRRAVRAIRALRDIVPQARIIVTCAATDEPQAQDALRAGADDYVLEPIAAEELEAALRLPAAVRRVPAEPTAPSFEEIVQFGEVLKHLDEGLDATLARLAALLAGAFQTRYAMIQVADATASYGPAAPLTLQESLRRHDEIVGTIALGPRASGGFSEADAARLTQYARLIETLAVMTREQARWQDLAWRDDLSGLRNRRYFEATLDKLLARAGAERRRLTIVLFDIDDFKTYNDQYGHDTGDALLREVAVLFTRCCREHDVVARYGGDEFTLILWDAEEPRLPGSQHPADAMALAERFCTVIRGHKFTCLGPAGPGPITISGGLACYPWDGRDRAELLRAADAALRAAKLTGKNRIVLAGADGPGPDIRPPSR